MQYFILDAPEVDRPQIKLSLRKVVGQLLRNCFRLAFFSWFLFLLIMTPLENKVLGFRRADWQEFREVPVVILVGTLASGLVCTLASLLVYLPIAAHIRKSRLPFQHWQSFRRYLPVVVGVMLVFVGLVIALGSNLGKRRPQNVFIAFSGSSFVTAIVGLMLFLRSVDVLLQKRIPSNDSADTER